MKRVFIELGPDGSVAHDRSANRRASTLSAQATHLNVSDGFHTFDELYDHRSVLYIALCRIGSASSKAWEGIDFPKVWRSKVHNDGTFFDGMFILGIGTETGEQITYHLDNKYWDDTGFAETLDKAPEWDEHTSADVLERLMQL